MRSKVRPRTGDTHRQTDATKHIIMQHSRVGNNDVIFSAVQCLLLHYALSELPVCVYMCVFVPVKL